MSEDDWNPYIFEDDEELEAIDADLDEIEELHFEQLYQDQLVVDEIAYYETPIDYSSVVIKPFVPQPIEWGSTMDRYDGSDLYDEGNELEL